MAGAGLVPQAIVLALGARALGGPDVLRLLLRLAGRSPAVDLAICAVVISLVTAPLLGTMLLARFVRKPRAGRGAPATDLFAQLTATLSVGAALLVTACLLVVPGGLGGAVRLPIDFAVLAICAAAAGGYLSCAVHLRARFFGGAGNAGGPAPSAPATRTKVAMFLAAMSSLVAFVVASGGFDAQLHFPGFNWRRRMVTMPVGIAIVTVAGTTLIARCSRWARNATAAGGGAAARTS